jgi:hypothetical protein
MFPLSVAAAIIADNIRTVPRKKGVLAFVLVCILFFVLGFPGISYLVKFFANLDGLARSSYLTEFTLISALGSVFVAFGSITLSLILISKCQKSAISSEDCLLGLTVLAIMELWFYIPKGYAIIDVGLTLVPFSAALIGVTVFSRRASKRSLCLFLGLALLGAISIDASSKWGYPRKADIFSKAPYVRFLENREDTDTYRILGFHGVLGPNYASSVKLQDVRFYTALSVRWYWYFVKDILMEGKEPTVAGIIKFSPAAGGPPRKDWDDYYQFSKAFRYYCLLGVKYILTWPGIDLNRHFVGQELPMIYNDEVKIYENPYAFPKAFMTYKVVSVSSWEEAQERLRDMDINGLKDVAVVEEKPPAWFQLKGQNDFSSEIQVIKYEENQILLEVDNEKNGLLVLNDVYYPGWRAYVNGRESNIYRVDGLFRGIFLREGKHEIMFKYRPFSYRKFDLTQLFGQFVN